MTYPTGSQPLWLEEWNARNAFNESQKQIWAEGNARAQALSIEITQRQLDFNAANGIKNPVYLEEKARSLGLLNQIQPPKSATPTSSLTTPQPSNPIPSPTSSPALVTSPNAPTNGLSNLANSLANALPKSLTTVGSVLTQAAQGAVIGQEINRNKELVLSLPAIAGGLYGMLSTRIDDSVATKANARYEQALKASRLSPPVPTLGQNAGLPSGTQVGGDPNGVYDVTVSYDLLVDGVSVGSTTRTYTGLAGAIGGVRVYSPNSNTVSIDVTVNGVTTTYLGSARSQGGLSFQGQNVSIVRVNGGTDPNVLPPFVDTANPVRSPQENSLPWLPSVDLRGSNADRLAFPPEYQKTPNAVPVPSTAPRTKPNIPTSPDPEGKKKPTEDPEGKKKPQPNPNSTPVSGATPIVVTGVTTSAFSIPAVDPSTALVLGALAAGTATTTNLLNQVNNQTKPEAQQTNAKQGVCDAMQPSQCGFEGVKQATTEATNPIKEQTVANGGALASLLNLLTTVWEFLQNRLGKVLNILNNTVVDRTLAVMNLATNIHNAAMLTRDIGETLGSVVDNVISLTPLRFTNSEGSQVQFTDFIGSNFRSFLVSVLGAENYVSLVLQWQKANTIYHATMGVVNTTQSMIDPISSALEYGMGNVSRIGNSLKEDGVVSENAYPAMDETIRARRVNRFERLNDTLEGAENIASNLSSVTSSAVSIKEDYKQLREDAKDLKDKATAFNTADSEARAALKAELPTEITPITLAPAPAEDEEP